ncbi:MAG: hypothetical protein Q7J35_08675 [Candidatus Methanoperedens sp.]|nr:hypothetical protein [Candidatus Methanoperedens sp.]
MAKYQTARGGINQEMRVELLKINSTAAAIPTISIGFFSEMGFMFYPDSGGFSHHFFYAPMFDFEDDCLVFHRLK